jgi:hypothetical protein
MTKSEPRAKLGFAQQFLDSVGQLNEFLFDRAVLRYQDSILNNGSFTVLSPFTGTPTQPLGSAILPGHQIGYYFADASPFWLIAGNIRFGSPISWLILVETGELVSLPSLGPASNKALARIAKIKPGKALLREPVDAGALIIGHINFAHHLWNELAGLERWLSQTRVSAGTSFEIYPLFEPLGRIDDILPALRDMKINRDAAPKTFRFHRTIFTRIGSTKVTSEIGAAVLQAAEKSPRLPKALTVARKNFPTFWVTARLENRTCENQTEFLIALFARLGAIYPHSHILVDGFSWPDDFASNRYSQVRKIFAARASKINDYIEALIAKAVSNENRNVINVSGLTIPQAILLAGSANFYVTHAGSVQHKIGWLHCVPGYIHTCRSGLTNSGRQWYASQYERAKLPFVAPKHLIEDTEIGSGINNVSRNYNYRIVSIERLLDDIVEKIAASL